MLPRVSRVSSKTTNQLMGVKLWDGLLPIGSSYFKSVLQLTNMDEIIAEIKNYADTLDDLLAKLCFVSCRFWGLRGKNSECNSIYICKIPERVTGGGGWEAFCIHGPQMHLELPRFARCTIPAAARRLRTSFARRDINLAPSCSGAQSSGQDAAKEQAAISDPSPTSLNSPVTERIESLSFCHAISGFGAPFLSFLYQHYTQLLGS